MASTRAYPRSCSSGTSTSRNCSRPRPRKAAGWTTLAAFVCLPVGIVVAQAGGWRATPEVVAWTAQQQPGFNYDESKVPAYTLPDPLAAKGGPVRTAAQWRIRRAEILNLFRDNVYGRSPGRPERLSFAAIQYGQLAPDNKDRFREGAIALFEGSASGPRPPHAWGAIAAWVWGASRAMDYFATDPRIDAQRVAVVGHSRGGKAALWAGAEDERFALVISNESGEGGAAASRRWFGETVARINTSFPHWFTDTYKTFNDRVAELPVDQHMLLALTAPRALYVASADEDLWSDPRGEFLSLAASSPVFALWGDPPIRPDEMPALDTPLVVGRRAYHVRAGTHNLTPYDWDRFADFADRVWR